jgi:hypothetical protein
VKCWANSAIGSSLSVKAPPPNRHHFHFRISPSSAGQLTIPAATLLALPPGGGKLIVMNATTPQTVSDTGLDLGLATGVVSIEVPQRFK